MDAIQKHSQQGFESSRTDQHDDPYITLTEAMQQSERIEHDVEGRLKIQEFMLRIVVMMLVLRSLVCHSPQRSTV